MILSILIATIDERREQFIELKKVFGKTEGVEIVSACDNKEMSIGWKRQTLLEMAKGEYIVFFDDDDWPSPEYITEILKALESKPDCVGFKITYLKNGNYVGTCIHSLQNKEWSQQKNNYLRSVTHFNPVKRELALKVGFKDMRFGEDKEYSDRLTLLCKTEVFIDKYLFDYRYSHPINHEEHNKKYGIKDNA